MEKGCVHFYFVLVWFSLINVRAVGVVEVFLIMTLFLFGKHKRFRA